jgi:hypothetical protein
VGIREFREEFTQVWIIIYALNQEVFQRRQIDCYQMEKETDRMLQYQPPEFREFGPVLGAGAR